MTSSVGGIDPHQDTFTVGIVDANGVETCHEAFENTAAGYGCAIDLLDAAGVELVGVEGSAKWGAHVAVALVAAGFDAREIPASRSAAQRRSRRLEKTDAVDAVACARALLAEPTLGPVQALEAYDPLVAEIEAVLEHRRALVAARTLALHHIADQISKLPAEIRDQLTSHGKIEGRLRRLEHIDPDIDTTPAGAYRLGWLQAFVDQDRTARRDIRRLDELLDQQLGRTGLGECLEPGAGRLASVEVADRALVRREGHAGEGRVSRQRLAGSQRVLDEVAGEGDVDLDGLLVVAPASLGRFAQPHNHGRRRHEQHQRRPKSDHNSDEAAPSCNAHRSPRFASDLAAAVGVCVMHWAEVMIVNVIFSAIGRMAVSPWISGRREHP